MLVVECTRHARICEAAGRWDEMLADMKTVADASLNLDPSQQNLLSSAFDRLIEAKRRSLATLTTALRRDTSVALDRRRRRLAAGMRARAAGELAAACDDKLAVATRLLLAAAPSCHDSRLLYATMRADALRVRLDCTDDTDEEETRSAAAEAYLEASSLARSHPNPANALVLTALLKAADFAACVERRPTLAVEIALQARRSALRRRILPDARIREVALLIGLIDASVDEWRRLAFDVEKKQPVTGAVASQVLNVR